MWNKEAKNEARSTLFLPVARANTNAAPDKYNTKTHNFNKCSTASANEWIQGSAPKAR